MPNIRGYRPELDAVRFIAFLLVFVHHVFVFSLRYWDWIGKNSSSIRGQLLVAFSECGSIGLCLFFALSAYLITTLLLQERSDFLKISVRMFYMRRILRIWPLYILGLILGAGFALISHRTQDLKDLFWYLLLAGNIVCGLHGPLVNPMTSLWTISIEEQFYLIWPWAVRQLSRSRLVFCALVFIVIANCVLYALGNKHVDTDFVPWTNTFVQFEMFATGILLALMRSGRRDGRVIPGIALSCLGPILWFASCFFLHSKEPPSIGLSPSGPILCAGYALFALGCACVIHGFCIIGSLKIPRAIARLGRISYGLYVYHVLGLSVGGALVNPAKNAAYWFGRFALSLALTIAAALISYEYLEAPFLRLKRRFELVHSRPI